MSPALTRYDVVKALSSSMLIASLFCYCSPVRAAEQLVALNQALATIGLGIFEWIFILFIIIMVCAIHDGKSKDSKRENPREGQDD